MSDTIPADGRSNEGSSRRELPDPAICRATLNGTGVLVECLVKHPVECPHALIFATHSFCDHPQNYEIAARP